MKEWFAFGAACLKAGYNLAKWEESYPVRSNNLDEEARNIVPAIFREVMNGTKHIESTATNPDFLRTVGSSGSEKSAIGGTTVKAVC